MFPEDLHAVRRGDCGDGRITTCWTPSAGWSSWRLGEDNLRRQPIQEEPAAGRLIAQGPEQQAFCRARSRRS